MDIATEGPTERKTCLVVNEQDEVQYLGGLAECHVRPMTLHRAFSLFIFDEQGALLLQQRAKTKYTFPLAWTNTVCSHPRNADKTMEEWINLRVQDELGWTIKNIESRVRPVGKLTYSAISDAKYGEKEIDTLYFLQIDNQEKEDLKFNKEEVEAIDWVEPSRLETLLADDSKLITPWFRAIARGYGHPFYEKMKNSPKAKGTEKEAPQDISTGSGINIQEFVEPSTGATLPWFQVGDCSFPRAAKEHDYLLQGPYSYLKSNPGKVLRTQLVKLYADIDEQVSEQDVEGLSWVVERIHTASLLHDDIEDCSTSRRGAVCSHLLWGTAQTINTGTFNFLLAAQGVDDQLAHRPEGTRSTLIREILNMELELHRGQNADITWGENAMCPTVGQYIEMIDHKTGALFRACAELGSVCSGNRELGTQMGDVFIELGRFFQIRDDLCNICDPYYWKGKGFYEDADEGKYSYPVLVYFEKTAPSVTQNEENKDKASDSNQDREWLRKRLADRENPMSLEEKQKAYQLLYTSNALHETRDYCLTKLETLRGSMLLKSPRGEKILTLLYLVDIMTPVQVSEWLAGNN